MEVNRLRKIINSGTPITVIPRDRYVKGVTEVRNLTEYASNDEINPNWYFDDLRVGDIGRYAKYNDFIKILVIFEESTPLYGHLIAVQSSWEEANEKLRNK